MYKTIRKIHLWFSAPLGLIMSLICATGLIMLFEPTHTAGGERSEFFLNIMRLHRWLLDTPAVKGGITTGKMIVAITVVCMVVAILSGIMLWWLRARHNPKQNLQIKINGGIRKFCTTLHTSGGIYVAIFLLIIALTGLTWSFSAYREWVYNLFDIAKDSHTIYQIHTGALGGIITRIIWFIAALTGLTLPLSGYYMWIKRITKNRNHPSKDLNNVKNDDK